MPPRTLQVDGQRWEVGSSGRVTQYGRDEFSVQFRRLDGPPQTRVARYSPLGARSPEASLSELTERQLLDLFHHSQPSWTAPEAGYRR
jgi:hypothetical protein